MPSWRQGFSVLSSPSSVVALCAPMLTCAPPPVAAAHLPPLPQGASGQVDQVLVRPPCGAPFLAARKRMPANLINAVMLADEVAALRAGAGCPNIVQLYDLRTTDSHVELLMELVGGGTVAEELVGAGRACGTRGGAAAGRGGAWHAARWGRVTSCVERAAPTPLKYRHCSPGAPHGCALPLCLQSVPVPPTNPSPTPGG